MFVKYIISRHRNPMPNQTNQNCHQNRTTVRRIPSRVGVSIMVIVLNAENTSANANDFLFIFLKDL